MPAITEQKLKLRREITPLVVERYYELGEGGREAVVAGLVARLTATMTLAELRAWHDKLSRPLDNAPDP